MNKTILVTGAASGIGLACVRLLRQERANVVAFDPQQDRMEEVFDGGDPNLLTIGGDVSVPKDCDDAVAVAVSKFGRLDGLIHCGAAHSSARWDELDPDDMNRVLAVNVTGSFLIARAAAKHMQDNGGGSIVLTTSASVLQGVTGGSGQGGPAYVSSKGGVIALMRSLARALGPAGVRVNAVSPGLTETAMIAGYTDEQRNAMMQRFPLGRFAAPEEIAQAALFLISDRASFMTGENMHVNGGSNFGG